MGSNNPTKMQAPARTDANTCNATECPSSEGPPPVQLPKLPDCLRQSSAATADIWGKHVFKVRVCLFTSERPFIIYDRQGLNVELSVDMDLNAAKVDLILALAYESRDLRIGELFVLQRKHRRAVISQELLHIEHCDAQERVSEFYKELDGIKKTLVEQGFREQVDKYAGLHELPGVNSPPSSFGFFYERPGILSVIYRVPATTDKLAQGVLLRQINPRNPSVAVLYIGPVHITLRLVVYVI